MKKMTKKRTELILKFIDKVNEFNTVFAESKGKDEEKLTLIFKERSNLEKGLKMFLDFYQVRFIEDIARYSKRFNWDSKKIKKVLSSSIDIYLDVE